MPAPHRSVFTGRMFFQLPNQQRQRTEGNKQTNKPNSNKSVSGKHPPTAISHSCGLAAFYATYQVVKLQTGTERPLYTELKWLKLAKQAI